MHNSKAKPSAGSIVLAMGLSLVVVVILMIVEWWIIDSFVTNNPVTVFSIVAVITAVVAGTLIGQGVRRQKK